MSPVCLKCILNLPHQKVIFTPEPVSPRSSVNCTTLYPNDQPTFLGDIFRAFFPFFSCLMFNQSANPISSTSTIILICSLQHCLSPSQYHILCGFFFSAS